MAKTESAHDSCSVKHKISLGIEIQCETLITFKAVSIFRIYDRSDRFS